MSNILDRYGIKEVADVTFYEIVDGQPGKPVLYLDTLKVSNIEQTAENTSARGGKGNPELIMWDYGKEITVTLEDALFSPRSMAMMYGVDDSELDENGNLRETEYVLKTVKIADYDSTATAFKINGQSVKVYKKGDNGTYTAGAELFKATGESATDTTDAVYAKGYIKIADGGTEIVISADKFPGTYYVTGDTYARSEANGTDEFFQFVLPKAKMQSEVTLTMEAEGDPTTFNMTLKVLRPEDGEMMKLIKYNLPESSTN